jgi:hypothetical protein
MTLRQFSGFTHGRHLAGGTGGASSGLRRISGRLVPLGMYALRLLDLRLLEALSAGYDL